MGGKQDHLLLVFSRNCSNNIIRGLFLLHAGIGIKPYPDLLFALQSPL